MAWRRTLARVGWLAPISQFWDRTSGTLIAEFDQRCSRTTPPIVMLRPCEQVKTAGLLLERLRGFANVEIMFGHAAIDLQQSQEGVRLDVRGPRAQPLTAAPI